MMNHLRDVIEATDREPLLRKSNKDAIDETVSITVNEVIESIGFGRFQLQCFVVLGFIWAVESMEITLLSLLGPILICEWQITTLEAAILTSITFLGFAIGSPCFGWFCDKFGRKLGITLSVLCTCYFGCISAAAGGLVMAIILRSLAGLGVGGIAQCVTMLTELVPIKQRAKCILSLQVFSFIGVILEGALAYGLLPTIGWRILLLISILPLLAFLILRRWLAESPRHLLLLGKRKEATNTLEKIAKVNNKPMPEGILVAEIEDSRGNFRDLFNPTYRKTTILLWWTWIAGTLLYYSIILMTPMLFQIPRCNSYGSSTADCRCKPITRTKIIFIIISGAGELLGGLVVFLIIDRIGRKKCLGLAFLFSALSSFLLIICADRIAKEALIVFSRSSATAVTLTFYVYAPEVYPTKFRAVGIGSGSAMARIGSILSPFIAQVLFAVSDILALSVSGVIAVTAVIGSLLLPVETKGRPIKERS